ncbi:MAG: tetratricopeptide repeat protein [Burkholderiales bacterium]|nr:tetratricopeptide repeat protein [Burkholderiales bacterium]
MNLFDACGVPISTGNRASIDRYEAAVGMLLGRTGDPQAEVAAALAEHPQFVMGYCLRAAVLIMSTDEANEPALRECLTATDALAPRANDRERRHIAAARAWLERDFAQAIRMYGEMLIDYPRDRLALRIAHFGDFHLGQRGMLRDRVAQVLPYWDQGVPGYGYILAMYAFGLEETAHYEQAEDTARRALEIERSNPGAIHAIAHVMEMQGRQREGIAWLNGTASQWDRRDGAATHHWWHLALFHFDLNEVENALDIYDTHIVAGPRMSLSALVDASALLWRLHLRGLSLRERWHELARRWAAKRLSGGFPFHDLHALVAFIRAGDSKRVEQSLRALRDRAAGDDPGAQRVREMSLPIAESLAAFGNGDYGAAIERLGRVRVMEQLSGSHAQRDALHLTLIEAALRDRQMRLARALAAERTALKPGSVVNRALTLRAEAAAG